MTANNQTAPLTRFARAPENARATVEHDAEGLAALAGSLASSVGMLDPLKVYEDGDTLQVWDGGRRLAALQLLAQGETPPPLLDAVPYIVTDREAARLGSMATFLREEMHPADRFFAYAAMFDAGQTPEQIAAACAVSPRGVAQLLRFRCLAPEILDAFRAGAFDFDAALAFTLTTDHDHQRTVLASFGERQPAAFEIKRALKGEAVRADHVRARYVGREAYEAAGGRFLLDLFAGPDTGETWQDGGILQKLFDEKLAALVAEVEAEGWGKVEVADDDYSWKIGLHPVEPGEGQDLTAEQKAGARAIIVIHEYRGDEPVTVERGWVSHKAEPKAKGETPAQSDPARWGWGHSGHEAMTVAASMATRAALIANPAAAYDALVAHLAWEALGRSYERVSSLAITSRGASEAEGEAFDAWQKRLPCDNRLDFVEAVAALDADDKAALLALCFALTVFVREGRTDGHNASRWVHMGWMARHAGVAQGDLMAIDADFLKKGTRAALDGVLATEAPDRVSGMAGVKKGTLVAFLADKVKETGWVPRLLADLLVDPKAEAPAKAKAPRQSRKKAA